MSGDRGADLRMQLIGEIWDELSTLKGKELDDYLVSIGLGPEELVEYYSKAKAAAVAAPNRARFEEARRLVRRRQPVDTATILAFDPARKKQIMEALKDHPEMTRAARNGRIANDADVDAFLEACVRLGVIDADGNLKG